MLGKGYHLLSKWMQKEKRILGKDDMCFGHVIFQMPMDHKSRDVQQEDTYLILKFGRSTLAQRRYLEVISGRCIHEWNPQRECVK